MAERDEPYAHNLPRNLAYDSGERQTGMSMAAIRKDHIYRYELARSLILANERKPTNIADVFCGNGYGSRLLSGIERSSILAIDGCADAIAVANTHYAAPNIFFSWRIFPFSLPKSAFDYAVSIESIEHTELYPEFICELSGCLRPGGYLFATTPDDEKLPFRRGHHKFHVKHFAPKEVVALAARNDLMLAGTWGQDVYRLNEKLEQTDLLDQERMHPQEGYRGQFSCFFFRKCKGD